MYIEAENYDEAWEEALENHREEILEEFIKQHTNTLDIEYGTNRPYECCGGEDYDWNSLGYIEISINDFDFYIEDLDFIYELGKEGCDKKEQND